MGLLNKIKGTCAEFPDTTMLGALADYISSEKENFQPMNANFGILKPLDVKIKDKKERYTKLAQIAISDVTEYIEKIK